MNVSAMEKRRNQRFPVDVIYRLFIDNEKYSGRINNISSAGAYLASIDPQLSPACVSRQGVVDLYLEDAGWVSAKCEIVYVGDPANECFAEGAGISITW